MQNKKEQLKKQLEYLERELKEINLWSDTAPSAKDISSKEPFCVDTMSIENWLQWVFIPKIRELIAIENFIFTHKSDIHTMTNYVFSSYKENTTNINNIIKKIDFIINI